MRILAFFFLAFYSFSITGQVTVVQKKEHNNSLTVLSQKQVNEITQPTEGLTVLNSTTGCLNYFLNNRWYQLCGACLPETSPYRIDSMVQNNGIVEIYFKKGVSDTLHITSGTQHIRLTSEASPCNIKVPLNADSMIIQTYASNECYSKQQEASIVLRLKKVSVSKQEKVNIEGKKIGVKILNGITWMCEDWNSSNSRSPVSEQLMNYSDKMCPSGWNIPKKKDWQELLSIFEGNVSEIFENAETESASIQLRLLGAYSNDEKKMYSQGSTGSYWVGETDSKGKQYLINITRNGYMFVSENKEKARLNLRCVKYE